MPILRVGAGKSPASLLASGVMQSPSDPFPRTSLRTKMPWIMVKVQLPTRTEAHRRKERRATNCIYRKSEETGPAWVLSFSAQSATIVLDLDQWASSLTWSFSLQARAFGLLPLVRYSEHEAR